MFNPTWPGPMYTRPEPGPNLAWAGGFFFPYTRSVPNQFLCKPEHGPEPDKLFSLPTNPTCWFGFVVGSFLYFVYRLVHLLFCTLQVCLVWKKTTCIIWRELAFVTSNEHLLLPILEVTTVYESMKRRKPNSKKGLIGCASFKGHLATGRCVTTEWRLRLATWGVIPEQINKEVQTKLWGYLPSPKTVYFVALIFLHRLSEFWKGQWLHRRTRARNA